uniref:Putative secreted protein 94 n=1 Tax=Amblyomma parvum TaxID=251391 RepID=A0A023FZ20_AMBPA
MLIATFFIMGLGLCDGNSLAQNLTRRTIRVVRTEDNLRLLTYTPDLEEYIPKCLMSRFLKRTREGATRTLETNNKLESKEINTDGQFAELYKTISISVKSGTPPYLQTTSDKGPLPPAWPETQYVQHAKPEQCLILGSSPDETRKHPCTLWGFKKCNTSCVIKCQKIFVKKCGVGRVVDLTKCTPIEAEKGDSKYPPK